MPDATFGNAIRGIGAFLSQRVSYVHERMRMIGRIRDTPLTSYLGSEALSILCRTVLLPTTTIGAFAQLSS